MSLAPPGIRRDIDGLRSVAILPVLLFHTHVPGFSGGYVGVDIFFVISGFLITGIIARELDAGTFSLVGFYERRARRILPALLAMVAFVLAGASWLYLPGDFEGVPPSALMSLAFLSNVWFFLHTGYFAGEADTMPLLHCWSLAVEEQFYIGFPLLLWWLARHAPHWRNRVVIAGTALSFVWAWAVQAAGDGFAFYLLPTRAWELMAGGLLALGVVPRIHDRRLRESAAFAGLAAIIACIIFYTPDTLFPGLAALPPVAGTALLIHCAPGTLVGRMLSLRLPVAIGLISYSLYLWHWPLVVFAEYTQGRALAGSLRIAIIAVAFGCAWASWRFIERPFRQHGRFSQRQIFLGSGLGLATLAALATGLIPLGGWPDRFPPQVAQLAAARDDYSPKRHDCLSKTIGGERPECTIGAATAPSALLWGDSHGVELAWVIGQEMGRHGQSLMQRTRGSCPPAIGYARAQDPGCSLFNAEVLDRIGRTPSIRTVYLAAFWINPAYHVPGMAGWLDSSIARLQAMGKQVVIIGPVPSQPYHVPRHLALQAARHQPIDGHGASTADYARKSAWFTRQVPNWRARGVTVIDPAAIFVNGPYTRLTVGNAPLYFDRHHLSLAGARTLIAPDFPAMQ